MNLSNYLAELWGITIVVVSLALLMRLKRLEGLFTEVKNEATMFFWGIVSLVIGIAMVLIHNVWVSDWRVVITILGWLTLVKGLDVLFLPQHMRKRWLKMENWKWVVILVFLQFIGLALTYLGLTA